MGKIPSEKSILGCIFQEGRKTEFYCHSCISPIDWLDAADDPSILVLDSEPIDPLDKRFRLRCRDCDRELGAVQELRRKRKEWRLTDPAVLDLLLHWNGKFPILQRHRDNTQLARNVREKASEALKTRGVDEIKAAIDFYVKVLSDPSLFFRNNLHPPWRVGLDNFFSFDRFVMRIIKKNRIFFLERNTWFELCLKQDMEPLLKHFKELPEDEAPEITTLIWKPMKEYFNRNWGGCSKNQFREKLFQTSPKIRDCFERCSPRMVFEWHREWDGFLHGCFFPHLRSIGCTNFKDFDPSDELFAGLQAFLLDGGYFSSTDPEFFRQRRKEHMLHLYQLRWRVPVLLQHRGETKSVEDWAAQLGMSKSTIWGRLKSGWTVAEALDLPLRSKLANLPLHEFSRC